MVESITIRVMAVIFLATTIRSAFGFGEALVAMPLLALINIPVKVAAPLVALLSVVVAIVVIAEDWRKVHFRSASWLVVSAFCGIPFGLLLLTMADERIVKVILATVLITFSTYCLRGARQLELKSDSLGWLLGFGFISGVLGGAYNMNGPPLVIYGALRHWSAERFRATLQGYFLPASLLGLCGYCMAGLWVADVTRYFLISLPILLAAIFLGRAINRRMQGRSFVRYVYVGLVLVGIILLIQSLVP
ncbi:MAG TPA: sulfite exporter TauE/SafE family protein [Gemmataceae bacterium]|nr:sulfite exporter TauE/SafE family protein [Gemmataceae bacterium]